MTDPAPAASTETPAFANVPRSSLVPQLAMMFRALLQSQVRNRLFMLGAMLVAVIGLTAYGQIRLNDWNQPFTMRSRTGTSRAS